MPDPIPTELVESIADDLAAIRARLDYRNEIEGMRLRMEFLSLVYAPQRVVEILRVEYPFASHAFRRPE
jgi:hypothetical protein